MLQMMLVDNLIHSGLLLLAAGLARLRCLLPCRPRGVT